jgi:MobA/MobL family/Large polyvalent protein-associated domain 7
MPMVNPMAPVAFSRVSFAVVSRSTGGDAVKAAAYNLSGRLQHAGRRYDFRHKAAEHFGGTVLLPPGAPPELRDPGALWRTAEAAERRHDAQTARQILLSIPRDVPPEMRLAFAEAVAAPWVADGAACQIDVHCPQAADSLAQPHAHIMITMRRVSDSGFTQQKAREWNQAFREDGGRAERRRIEERANAWLAARGIAARMDMRSLADRGDDRPPEPSAPRKDWQRWQREGAVPDQAPETVRHVLQHRRQRAALADAEAAAQAAETEATSITAQIAAIPIEQAAPVAADSGRATRAITPPTTEAPTMATKPRPSPSGRRAPARRPAQKQHAAEPWMRWSGGLDALPDHMQQAARASYGRWSEQNPAAARRHDVADYVGYVQDRHAETETVDDEAAQDAAEIEAEGAQPPPNGIAPTSTTAGDHRRRALLAALLAEHYPSPPPDLAALVHRIDRDRAAKMATLHLRDGARIVDRGDRLEHLGQITPEAASATAAAAAAHGWNNVRLTGSMAYKDEVGIACVLRQPPVQTDHVLSREAAERVASALRQRAAQAVRPLDPATLRATAAADPAAAATTFLSHVEARARAALAGRPSGSTDPAEIARPRIAELISSREQAREDAREAVQAAARHRTTHPWTSRLLDPAARRRQAALDDEAARLDRAARRLDRGHERAVRRIEKAARQQAIATAAALEDWRWTKPVRTAEAQLEVVARIRTAITAGDSATFTHAARGNLGYAAEAAQAHASARQAAATPPQDPRSAAITALHAAEAAVAHDPAALSRARQATKAALSGNQETITATVRGDTSAAQTAAEQWKRQQEQEERQRRATREAEQAPEVAPETPTYS